MQLSIIIVNYKTADLLVNCIQSVIDHTRNLEYEIIVVDNASGDKSESLVTQKFPSVKWIQMNYNAGFARANNEGIRNSTSPLILLLNSDTILLDNTIGNVTNDFLQSPCVACGIQLLNHDGSPQISGNYVKKGGLNYILPLPFFGRLLKLFGNMLGAAKPNLPDSNSEVEVDWINGAFPMVKRSAIEKAGLMDEDFFLYAEEAEWCSRLKKVGKICIYGQYKVIHLQGATANSTFESTGKGYYNLSDRKGLQIILSNFVRIRKQFGIFWFLVVLMIYFLEILFSLIMILLGKLSWTSWKGYAKNVFRLIGYSGKIISNKPHFYKVL